MTGVEKPLRCATIATSRAAPVFAVRATAMERDPVPDAGEIPTHAASSETVHAAPSGAVSWRVSEVTFAPTVEDALPSPSSRVSPPVPPVPSACVTDTATYVVESLVR